jgi:hypothetical protein
VVEKLVGRDFSEEAIPTPMTRTSGAVNQSIHTREEREEALKTLYRLRAEWNRQKDSPAAALKAIERLIEEYEQEQR